MKLYPVGWPIEQQVPPLAAAVKAHAGIRSSKFTLPYRRLLVAFPYDPNRDFPTAMAEEGIPPEQLDMVLDSGAFSVWTQGSTIDLDAYIAWSQAYVEEVPHTRVTNLDVIAGKPGKKAPTRKERELAVAESASNAAAIRESGLPVIEVFHWHEPFEALEGIIERRQPGEIIGIGGLAGPGDKNAKRLFVESCFHVMLKSSTIDALIPAHGFGIAPESALAYNFPWYSIDASSWLTSVRYGRGVSRGGKVGAADSRTAMKEVSALYLERRLREWDRLERSYNAMALDRGVRFTPDTEEITWP